MNRRAFTLVELLVVIGIIAVLISFLMPALKKARQSAKDVECASTMRQALMAVQMYNAQYRGGLTNYLPDCPYWHRGFPDGTGPGSHYALHAWEEGRAGRSNWRGYLLESKLAKSTILGCPYTDYSNDPFLGSYHTFSNNGQNFYVSTDPPINETNPTAPTFRKNPAFVWYGEPTMQKAQVNNTGAGGNLDLPYPDGPSRPYSVPKPFKRGLWPLFTCPQVFIADRGSAQPKFYQPTHRPEWGFWVTNYQLKQQWPYAANVGFNDGSVRFFSSNKFGVMNVYNPLQM
jgi:prepilin-type N-terminal cleavage/methylation domain-containing protein